MTPIDLSVEPLRIGRTFSTVAVRAEQNGTLVGPALMLMGSGAPETIRDAAAMPDVPGPYESEPYDMRVTGRDLRIVDGAYSPDPDRIGPPVIYTPGCASVTIRRRSTYGTHWWPRQPPIGPSPPPCVRTKGLARLWLM